jgi:hypothetical protein
MRISLREQLVENVVVSLGWLLKSNSWLLKQVRFNVSTSDFAARVEVNTDEFTETRWVIVTCSFSITVRL